MKYLLLFFLPLMAYSQTDTLSLSAEQRVKVFAVAEKWITELTKGEDIDGLMGITTVPFWRDGDEMLTTPDDVKKFYNKVVTKKGKRTPPEIKKISFSGMAKRPTFKNGQFIVTIIIPFNGKEAEVYIYVTESNGEYKICGFKD